MCMCVFYSLSFRSSFPNLIIVRLSEVLTQPVLIRGERAWSQCEVTTSVHVQEICHRVAVVIWGSKFILRSAASSLFVSELRSECVDCGDCVFLLLSVLLGPLGS